MPRGQTRKLAQGQKPASLLALGGTTKVGPFPVPALSAAPPKVGSCVDGSASHFSQSTREMGHPLRGSVGEIAGAKARVDLEALRGAEAPLFHGTTRICEFFHHL
jgi:hypothetical protein